MREVGRGQMSSFDMLFICGSLSPTRIYVRGLVFRSSAFQQYKWGYNLHPQGITPVTKLSREREPLNF
jgi:hypothetical protein